MDQASLSSVSLLGSGKQVQDAEPRIFSHSLLRSHSLQATQVQAGASPGGRDSQTSHRPISYVARERSAAGLAVAAKRPFSTGARSCVRINCPGRRAFRRGSCARTGPCSVAQRRLRLQGAERVCQRRGRASGSLRLCRACHSFVNSCHKLRCGPPHNLTSVWN